MSEVALTEQLDQAIEAMLRNPDAPRADTDGQVVELISIAAELRALPRADFKARLKNELEREAAMTLDEELDSESETPTEVPRATFRTVTPYLTVSDVHAEIEFVTEAFGAEGRLYGLGSAGGFHSEYRIGDSMVMIGGGGKGAKWKGSPSPGSLHLYVKDVDTVYERALQAGATSLMAPTNQEYGDRDAAIVDVGGNHWYIGTTQGAAYKPEGVSDLMPYLHPTGAPKMISFLKDAFGAEEQFVYQSPDGTVRHAKITIGDSIVEMGEAHAQWTPMPMTFMLYVDDIDAWYERAMKTAGAISIAKPGDQAYGDRVGAVKDPFDNVWYIGTHIEKKRDK
jgi:PhnB protein